MACLAILLVVVLSCSTGSLAKVQDPDFQKWLTEYKIQMEDPDTIYPVWKRNADFVQQQNSLGLSYTVSLNQLAHLTPKELVGDSFFTVDNKVLTRPQPSSNHHSAPLPKQFDWREKGAVTSVKNQGQCGSAGAYAIVDSVASFGFIDHQNKELVQPSIQEYVDCCTDGTCTGGFFDESDYDCIAMNIGGLACNYPVNTNHTCKSKDTKICISIKGGSYVAPHGDEKALQEALLKQPIAVAIDASHASFQLYSSGVYYEPDCKSERAKLDHAVLLVGYGNMNGTDFWTVKNSWGASWGMNGYMMIARNRNNNCGIATEAIYPY